MIENCSWPGQDPRMIAYHDEEWGVPSKDDRYLFELITLEGAQSGLSWSIVLNKREGYQEAFHQFDIDRCANLSDQELLDIKEQAQIIKHLNKIQSVRKNAQAIQKIQKEYGSFAAYLWRYVDNEPIVNQWTSISNIPAQSELSVRLSKDLKKRGFNFVGPVTMYSYMQAVGMINDHILSCQCHPVNQLKREE
ncbi:DNA-3-methyladenine glycosylase I [Marinilactibacillus psychrotolerans]|uniref:DNA-3-methyladenine glycosylase n=1 Tax=Marinilactibacillus psychrotolerans 42ea TaxID=1255609 RepID=A0A1R4J637_9LACT|nr:DNA-3-methyladenine glycosylase I [Marinilactibacillus psychrotolerans]GEQ32651.1 DNA-3-methyladenine glycosylase I [Marinilactibacillus psychrotolerans]SJN27601.1 DNA-3-methyladenine glycosylase [Marinilactibacillus psychrotolerans 42ea]